MAPIPGETKVWQYVSLMKRIYLIDCPGVVPPSTQDTPTDLVLRGVARVEKVENPEQYISALLGRVKRHHMERTYELSGWENATEFLELLARKGGRLLRGGEPDLDGVAKMVLNDFMRGKIPWFTPAPADDGAGDHQPGGRSGRLGEMPKKRKQVESDEDLGLSADAQLQGENEVAAAQKLRDRLGNGHGDDGEIGGSGSDTDESRSGNASFGTTAVTKSDGTIDDDTISSGNTCDTEKEATVDKHRSSSSGGADDATRSPSNASGQRKRARVRR